MSSDIARPALDLGVFLGRCQRMQAVPEARLDNHYNKVMKGLIILLSIGIVSWAVLVIWVTWVASRSRDGYQDELGFHFGSGSDTNADAQNPARPNID